MTRWLIALVSVILLGVGTVLYVNGYQEKRAAAFEQQASAFQGQRDAAIRQANEEASKRVQIEAYIRAAEAKVTIARSKVPAKVTKETMDALPPAEVVEVAVNQDALIQELEARDILRQQEVESLKAENESLRRGIEAAEKQARALEIANGALKYAAKSGKMWGRIPGLCRWGRNWLRYWKGTEMTTESLSWARAKDAVILAIGAGLITFLGMLVRGQWDANVSLAEARKDIAVILVGQGRDREEFNRLEGRVTRLERRGQE